MPRGTVVALPESSLPNGIPLFLYSAVILFHSSTFGTPALRTASFESGTGTPVAMSRIWTKDTGIKPGPPKREMGFATNHSGFDCATTMIASPAFASSSSGLSAWKSYWTTPYTIAPAPLPMLLFESLDCLDVPSVMPLPSANPLSCVALPVALPLLILLAPKTPLSRIVLPMISKWFAGTNPLVPSNGLHASYQLSSFSLATT